MRTPIVTSLACAACLALAPAARPVPAPDAGKPIDLVICLDTSNSMDGLIDSAKIKLWDIVNDLAKVKPTPVLRVALYSYGNDGYDKDAGWVRKELDLTTDLDEVYRKLNALTTHGGTEYVGRVSRDALEQVRWSKDRDALKIIFVCGNEGAEQDPLVKLEELAGKAAAQGVIINTIYCGPAKDGIAPGWYRFAELAGGKGVNIDQEQARKEAHVKSPYDEKLLKLSNELNKTYLAYGARGAEGKMNQEAQDANAAAAAPQAALARAGTKASCLYNCPTWDLCDRLKTDPKFDITKLTDEELPEEMRKLKPGERKAYIEKKLKEREAIQKEVLELNKKREEFVREEIKKLPPNAAERAFDDAVRGLLRVQCAGKGFEVPQE
ncbi:MAG TPA: VWA domain-containing protein [Gemmataceae bacterium]